VSSSCAGVTDVLGQTSRKRGGIPPDPETAERFARDYVEKLKARALGGFWIVCTDYRYAFGRTRQGGDERVPRPLRSCAQRALLCAATRAAGRTPMSCAASAHGE